MSRHDRLCVPAAAGGDNVGGRRVATFFVRLDQARARTYTRDGDGKFASHGGIRQSLQDAKTPQEVAAVLRSEVSAILGRDVPVGLAGLDVEVARAHAEGVLRGAEAFPDGQLRVVGTYGPDSPMGHYGGLPETATAVTVRGEDILFNTDFGEIEDFSETMGDSDSIGHLAGAHGDLTRIGVHEFGHVVAASTPDTVKAARGIVQSAGSSRVKAEISTYATTNSREAFAEAFMDVVSAGADASPLSHQVFDAAVAAAGPANLSTFWLLNRQYKRDKDGQFSSGGGGGLDTTPVAGRNGWDADDPQLAEIGRVAEEHGFTSIGSTPNGAAAVDSGNPDQLLIGQKEKWTDEGFAAERARSDGELYMADAAKASAAEYYIAHEAGHRRHFKDHGSLDYEATQTAIADFANRHGIQKADTFGGRPHVKVPITRDDVGMYGNPMAMEALMGAGLSRYGSMSVQELVAEVHAAHHLGNRSDFVVTVAKAEGWE